MKFFHSHHATGRYAEMGISQSVAEDIVRHARVTYPSGQRRGQSRPCTTALSDKHPGYAVVFQRDDNYVRIVTVTFRTDADYERNGAGFIPKGVRR